MAASVRGAGQPRSQRPRGGSVWPDDTQRPTQVAVPQPGHFGNSGGNVLVGQGISVHHLSIAKTFAIFEQLRLTMTGQISNLFNHPHFNNPNSTINNPNPGLFTSEIPQYNPERQGARQIGLKIRLEW